MGLAHPPALDMLCMRGVFAPFGVAQDGALSLPEVRGLRPLTDPPWVGGWYNHLCC